MERKEFIEILLEIAFASMICDGDIAAGAGFSKRYRKVRLLSQRI